MGDMADLALEIASIQCEMSDAHYAGELDMQDAYDAGIIDEHGRGAYPVREYNAFDRPRSGITIKRVHELEGHPSGPTCTKCKSTMLPRIGRYGKFYYCGNNCDGQKAVSHKAFLHNLRGY